MRVNYLFESVQGLSEGTGGEKKNGKKRSPHGRNMLKFAGHLVVSVLFVYFVADFDIIS